MIVYFVNLLIALDQLVNTIFFGYPDETLSARSHRMKWRLEWYINLLFFWQTDGKYRNHCEQCYQHEQERMDLPPEYRKGFRVNALFAEKKETINRQNRTFCTVRKISP